MRRAYVLRSTCRTFGNRAVVSCNTPAKDKPTKKHHKIAHSSKGTDSKMPQKGPTISPFLTAAVLFRLTTWMTNIPKFRAKKKVGSATGATFLPGKPTTLEEPAKSDCRSHLPAPLWAHTCLLESACDMIHDAKTFIIQKGDAVVLQEYAY